MATAIGIILALAVFIYAVCKVGGDADPRGEIPPDEHEQGLPL